MHITPVPQTSSSVEELKVYGKRASDIAMAEASGLNDAIIRAIGSAKLNPEEIRRIVEFANRATFSQLFKTQKDKKFEFPLADFGAVMSQLEYDKKPKAPIVEDGFVGTSNLTPGNMDDDLRQIFGKDRGDLQGQNSLEFTAGPIEKKASMNNLLHLKNDLERAENGLAASLTRIERELIDAEEDFIKEAKVEILMEGRSPFDLFIAMNSTAPREVNEMVFPGLLDKLASTGVVRTEKLVKEAASYSAPDNILINSNSPFVIAYDHLIKVSLAQDETTAALQEIRSSLADLREHLKYVEV